MNKVLRTALSFVSMAVVMAATAQVDITDKVLTNAGFDDSSSWTATNVAAGATANSLAVAGWTVANSAAWSSSAAFGFGTEGQINGAQVPATNSLGLAEGGALGVSAGWGGTVAYAQTINVTLLAGTYTISYKANNLLEGVNQMTAKISFAGTEQTVASEFTYNLWEEKSATFTLAADVTDAELKIAFTAVSGGSGSNAKLFVDGITIKVAGTPYVSVVEAADAANGYWRTGNMEITKMENDFPGKVTSAEVATDVTVQETMDAANLAITAALESVDLQSTSVEAATAIAAINAAKADVDAAVAAAKSAYSIVAALAEIPAGKYYVQEVTTGKFLGAGNDWGTRASLVENSVEWTFTLADGKYKLAGPVGAAGKNFLGLDSGHLYCDKDPSDTSFKTDFVISKAGEGVYTLQVDGQYVAKVSDGFQNAIPVLDAAATSAQFKIVAADATKAKKNDNVTFVIKDADFQGDAAVWTVSEDCTNWNLCGGTNENKCAESDHSPFTITQKLNVPNGFYTVSAQAFYRQDGTDTENLPKLIANKRSVVFPVLSGSENIMNDASKSFAAGSYAFSVEVYVENGELTLGFANKNNKVWAIFDNVGLVYRANDATRANTQAAPELGADTTALQAALAAALTAVDALPDFAQDAVEDQEPGLEAAVAKCAADVKAAVVANTHGQKQDELEAAMDAVAQQIAAYVQAANDVVTANAAAADTQDEAFAALVAEWQEAYDKINTKYREYLGSDKEKYQSYLTSLNKTYIDIDALKATIASYRTNGTAVAKAEDVATSIGNLSQQIKDQVAGALADYESEVATYNANAKRELDELAGEKTDAYKEAILTISDHYAANHAAAADAAQAALFAVFEDLQDVKNRYIAEAAQIEEGNATKFAAEQFPLVSFDNTDYKDEINGIDVAGAIANALADAETAATTDNDAAYAAAHTKKLALDAALNDDVEAKITLYGLDRNNYKTAIEAAQALIDKYNDEVELAKIHGFHAEVAADATATPPVEHQDAYWACAILNAETFTADYNAANEAITTLAAQIKADQNAALLTQVKAATAAARARLQTVTDDIATYADYIAEDWADDVEAINTLINDVENQAVADDAAGKLIDTKAALIAKLGDPADTSFPPTAIADVTVGATSVKYAAFVVNETVGTAAAVGYDAYKLGTGSAKGSLVLNLPEGTTGFTFTAASWNGTADDKLIVKQGATVLKTIDPIKANTGIAGNSPLTVTFADADAKAAATYTVTLAAALTAETAVSFELEANNRFVIWDFQLAGGPAAPTAYQLINQLNHDTSNENLNNVYVAAANKLAANLTAAQGIATDLDQTIDGTAITAAIQQFKIDEGTDYDDNVLPENKATHDATVTGIQTKIDNALSVVYITDLKAQMIDLKKAFNNVTAEVAGIDSEIDKDDLWSQIEAEDNLVEALTFADKTVYDSHSATIANIGLQFTDYAQWIADNTKKGDLNIDDEVTIADVVKLVSILVNTENVDAEGNLLDIDLELSGLTQRVFYAADTNDDQKLDGADLQNVIDLMLGKTIAADVRAEAADVIGDYVLVNGSEIALVNAREYVNFTLVVSAASDALQAATTARTNGMQVTTTKVGNFYKIFAYSANNAAIEGGEGDILTLNADAVVKSASFVANGVAYKLNVEDATAIRSIEADLEGAEIYTVGGVKTSRLQKGVNVIRMADGSVKKVLVK